MHGKQINLVNADATILTAKCQLVLERLGAPHPALLVCDVIDEHSFESVQRNLFVCPADQKEFLAMKQLNEERIEANDPLFEYLPQTKDKHVKR